MLPVCLLLSVLLLLLLVTLTVQMIPRLLLR
jgi:hypothetical protein